MKKVLVLLIASCSLFFNSCATTSSTFGESSSSSTSDVKIFSDKFTGAKTYEYTKGLRGGFALSRGGLSADYLEIFPHLIVNEEGICSPFLEIKYIGSSGQFLTTGADKIYKKFIFLGNDERLEVSPIVIPNTEASTKINTFSKSVSIISDYSGSYSMQITKKQFDILKDYFSSKETIECAAYSMDGKVVTFKSYNNKWHRGVFSALDNCVKLENPNIEFNEQFTQAIIK